MQFLTKALYFPPVEEASLEGVLAVGGDLSVPRLLLAYQNGIFPWFNEDEPILWWAPPQRMVVAPAIYKVPKSLRNTVNQHKFQITFNQQFEQVIRNCQQIERTGQFGTWITEDIISSYCELHALGHAKSVEVWQEGVLVGGLYGVDLGHVFCGESMFSKVSNASKVGFVWLVNYLKENNYRLLDCQVYN
ncbi:MAG: leucyl/phenylalanyl-tRNA--protein transferase, partial [Flavobacterium sp.]